VEIINKPEVVESTTVVEVVVVLEHLVKMATTQLLVS
jgi:hypothetical protein